MNLYSLFFFNWNVFENLTPLEIIFRIITEFGSEFFYIIVIPPIYWCINKKLGFNLLILSTLTAYICTVFKNIFRSPRPPKRYWKATPESYSFPSGHAQGSSTFWFYLMIKVKRVVMIIVGSIFVVLISISRVILGVHFTVDVIAGIGLGIAVAIGFLVIEPRISYMAHSWSFKQRIFLITLFSLLVLIHSSLYFKDDIRGIKLAGALFGMLLGYALEDQYLKFSIKGSFTTKINRIIIGLFIAYLAHFGLGMVLPFNLITCLVTSWLGGFAVVFIAPWVFMKLEG